MPPDKKEIRVGGPGRLLLSVKGFEALENVVEAGCGFGHGEATYYTRAARRSPQFFGCVSSLTEGLFRLTIVRIKMVERVI